VSAVDRLPEGMEYRGQPGEHQYDFAVSLPADEDGFIGRMCQTCSRTFRLHATAFEELPDDLVLCCPYCGTRPESNSDYLTPNQGARVSEAGLAFAEQFVHEALGKIFSGLERSTRGNQFVHFEYKPGTRPPTRQLPAITEDRVRRVVTCPDCALKVAVFGAAAFCPSCGMRGSFDRIRDDIEAQAQLLDFESSLSPDAAEEMRSLGVLDHVANGTVKNVVTLFEALCKERFRALVPNAADVLKNESRTVFQSLRRSAILFRKHAGVRLDSLAGPDRWQRLLVVFAERHVLTHCNGIVDDEFCRQVPSSPLQPGQRLVISRDHAAEALADLTGLVNSWQGASSR
jgi:rubredoxin